MKRNKRQALYKYLPHNWFPYSDDDKSDDVKYECEVVAWNTRPIIGINETMIRNDIARKVLAFEKTGGMVDRTLSGDSVNTLEFKEPAMNDGIADIFGEINPATYYCEQCGRVKFYREPRKAPKCDNCHVLMKQLKLVYACECGFADGVRPNIYNKELFFHHKDPNSQFKFYDKNGRKIEMVRECPTCGSPVFPKNPNMPGLFYTQSGCIVNLYNKEYSDIYIKYGEEAGMLMLAKWFDALSESEFNKIIQNPYEFFNPKVIDINDPTVQAISKAYGIKPEEVAKTLSAQNAQGPNINSLKQKIDLIYPSKNLGEKLDLIISDLTEFDTLKHPKETIDLEKAISKNKLVGNIIEESEIYDLLNELHIKTIQVSQSVQIVNYSYGYTRLKSCPSPSAKPLWLKGFENNVYASILETEGILTELSIKSVIEWLKANNIVSSDLDIENEEKAKIWLMDNIDTNAINTFSEIGCSKQEIVTKAIYSLLHTISHLMIISAGNQSGISKENISEIIFPETCSFFIYPTSAEGVTLGSISGMFETNLKLFLEEALYEKENCAFDPICSENQNGACLACVYLNEVNCIHFNKDLSRAYLYGGNLKFDGKSLEIKKGFWK